MKPDCHNQEIDWTAPREPRSCASFIWTGTGWDSIFCPEETLLKRIQTGNVPVLPLFDRQPELTPP